MFAYNPQVNDQSGQLIAQGAQNAAAINQQMYAQMGQMVGDALSQMGNRYAESKASDAKVTGYDEAFKIAAPSLNLTSEQANQILKLPKDERLGFYENNLFGNWMRGQNSYNNSFQAAKAQYDARNQYGGGSGGGGGSQPFFVMPGGR